MPRSAASSSVPGEVTVTHSGGCGCCTGLGRIARSGTENDVPCQLKRSSVHMRGSARIVSSQVCLVVSGSISKPASSLQVDERAVPNSSRPPDRMSSTAARSAIAHRVVHLRHAHHRAVADPDALGLHRAGGEEELGRRAVRVLLEEVVLDGPDRVEAELVGQPHLLERVLVHLPLDAGRERPRHRQLVEDPEAHGPIVAGAGITGFDPIGRSM